MWKYTIEPHARDNLFAYIHLYKEYFIDTFTDTGLGEAEVVIRAGYEASSRKLFFQITREIDKKLSSMDIIPYVPLGDARVTTFLVERRYIAITYHEDQARYERVIQDIRIWRKR